MKDLWPQIAHFEHEGGPANFGEHPSAQRRQQMGRGAVDEVQRTGREPAHEGTDRVADPAENARRISMADWSRPHRSIDVAEGFYAMARQHRAVRREDGRVVLR